MHTEQLHHDLTEQDKIRALVAAVRRSHHMFVHDGIERRGAATADKLQLLLERDPTGAHSAREFIERIAAPERSDEAADHVILSDEQTMLATHWYHARLAELEGRPAPPADPEALAQAQKHARRLQILDALSIVERSDLRFVSPPRKHQVKVKPKKASKRLKKPSIGTKRQPKRKEYDGEQFADMLRKKWEFLGADIEDLDSFIHEIASDSFANMVRYRVIHPGGEEEDFAGWLQVQLDVERNRIAQGGAP